MREIVPAAPTAQDVQAVAPALQQYTDTTVYRLWQRPELSPRDRSMVTVTALITRGHHVELSDQLVRALEHGVTAGELSEIVTHLAFYAGWPTALAAVPTVRQVFDALGVDVEQLPRARGPLLPVDEPEETARAATVARDFGSTAPGVLEYTTDVVFGNLWLRAGLLPRDRSLVTVAALIAAGQTAQIPYHLGRAMDHGLSRSQAGEVLTQLAFYAGWPNVFAALPVVRDVFAHRDDD